MSHREQSCVSECSRRNILCQMELPLYACLLPFNRIGSFPKSWCQALVGLAGLRRVRDKMFPQEH